MLMEMVHASATRYLWQATLVFSATNLPTCPHHNGTMLFQHYLAGSFFFFFLPALDLGPPLKNRFLHYLPTRGTQPSYSPFFFSFGLEKLVTNSIF